MITFNDTNVAYQRFPFRNTLWNYVLKNLQPQHLIKLYQCCKFFYAKYRRNIIRNLTIVDKGVPETYHPTSTTISVWNPALEKLIDFWITDSFVYFAPLNEHVFLPSFSHCTIKKLEACNYLMWNEYEVLTEAGTVKELKIGQIYRQAHLVPVEELIAAVPNASSIEICECEITSTTVESLAALNHQVKIKKFILRNMTTIGGFSEMGIFLYKHVDVECNFHVDFALIPGEDDEIREFNERRKVMEKDINETADLILQKIKIENEIEIIKKGQML